MVNRLFDTQDLSKTDIASLQADDFSGRWDSLRTAQKAVSSGCSTDRVELRFQCADCDEPPVRADRRYPRTAAVCPLPNFRNNLIGEHAN